MTSGNPHDRRKSPWDGMRNTFSLLIFLLSFSISVLLWAGSNHPRLEQDVADLKRVQETNSKILADTAQQVTTLQQALQALKGAGEENNHFIQEGGQKNEKMLREFDYRLSGIEERLTLFQTQLNEFLSKGRVASTGKKGAESEAEGALYHRALAEINLQNFKEAKDLFERFLQKYPKSSLAGNAQYWKGEALYALKDYPAAILEFQKVIQKYSKSDKVPGAVLKQGYCFYEMKNYLDSKAFLKKVLADYPRSEEAAHAEERIAKIDKALAKGPVQATVISPP